jgi:hypothetical protein
LAGSFNLAGSAVTPASLGDHDGEATDIAATVTGPYISPVIVLRDPTGHHRLASLLLHPGRRPR